MAFVLLIVVLLIWLGYQYGRGGTESGPNAPPRTQGHPLHPSAAERRERYAEERTGRLTSISPEAGSWLEGYLRECESPAEEAFLRALVTEYALLPDKGALKGSGLLLQMQLDKGAHRVDFLANDWLVIEIDGAEYHASPEQLARDSARDRYLESIGYTVLRIAARTAFQQPEMALSDLRSALAAGRKQVSAPRPPRPPVQTSRPRPSNVFSAFARGVEAVGGFAKSVNEFAEREREIKRATSPADLIFFEEKRSIETALEMATSKLSVEKYVAENPERRERLEQIQAELEAALQGAGSVNHEVQKLEPIASICEPDAHPDPEINEVIRRKHAALMDERAAYFEAVRDQMRKAEGRLSTLVRAALIDIGRHTTWVELTGTPGQFARLHIAAASERIELQNFLDEPG